jgi:DNA polymerase-3 subunit alpha
VLIEAEPLDNNTVSSYEFEVLGLFITLHPLSRYQDLLARLNIATSLDLQNDNRPLLKLAYAEGFKGDAEPRPAAYSNVREKQSTGITYKSPAEVEFRKKSNGSTSSRQIRIAGVIQKKDSRMSSRGRFITLQLSDQFGIFELTIYSEEILKNFVHLLDIQCLVVANCDLFKDAGGTRLIAKSFTTIDDIMNEELLEIKLYPQNHYELCQIIDLLKKRISPERSNTRIILLLKVSTDNNFTAKVYLPEILCLETEDFEFLNRFMLCSTLIP